MLTEREIIDQAAKNLPRCDCTSMCSDDSRIEDGTHAPCKNYVSWAQARIDQRQLELDGRRMQELCRIIDTSENPSTLQKAYREATQEAMLKGSAALLMTLDSTMAIQTAVVQIPHEQ
ncbi:MAG: hypothetical protein RR800_00480 [Comamonas sp.]